MSQQNSVTDPPSYHSQRVHSPNVLVVGETGTGKSSVINLIAGERLADVDSGAGGCTLEATSYDVVLYDDHDTGHHIRLFDTVGLNEPSFSKNNYLGAIHKANTLICQLQRTGGIRLLIFCIRGGRVTHSTQNNYRLFCDIMCQNEVPVAFVITGMEGQQPMEGWWKKNASVFEKYQLSCTSHVCVTATLGLNHVYEKKYHESQKAIHDMLLKHVSGQSWHPERRGWFVHLAGRLLGWVAKVTVKSPRRSIIVKPKALTVEELARHLEEKCKFLPSEAAGLAKEILATRQKTVGPDFVKGEDSCQCPLGGLVWQFVHIPMCERF